VAQKFGYNGVELEESLGLNLMEMNFRQYDPAIARWTSIDPVTHWSMSTYSAFDNNPVFFADPSGADSIYNWDTGQYVINGVEVSQDEAIAYANNGGNSDGSNNNNVDDSQGDEDCCGGAVSAYKGLQKLLNKSKTKNKNNQKEDNYDAINKALKEIAKKITEQNAGLLDNIYWVGVTKKGKIGIYERVKFKGNQFVTNRELFKKAGYIGFIVQTGVDYQDFKSNPTPHKAIHFVGNTTIGAYSLAFPQVGVVYFAGTMLKQANDWFFERPETKKWFDNLTIDFDRFLREDGY
jgi:RHS repeat-associated protein